MKFVLFLFIVITCYSCEQSNYFEGRIGSEDSYREGMLLDAGDYDLATSGGADILNEGNRTYIASLNGVLDREGRTSSYLLVLYLIENSAIRSEIVKMSATLFYQNRSSYPGSENSFVRVFRDNGQLSIFYLRNDKSLVLLQKDNDRWIERVVLEDVVTFTIDDRDGEKLAYSDGWNYYYCSNVLMLKCERVGLELDIYTLFPAIRLFHNQLGEPIVTGLFWNDRATRDARPIYLFKKTNEWNGLYHKNQVFSKQIVGSVYDGQNMAMCFYDQDQSYLWTFDADTHQLILSEKFPFLDDYRARNCLPLLGQSDRLLYYPLSRDAGNAFLFLGQHAEPIMIIEEANHIYSKCVQGQCGLLYYKNRSLYFKSI